LAATAEISNSITEPPLTPAPAWVPNKAYLSGEAIQNGPYQYLCKNSGTSAAAGGPSGTSYADISDGTAAWVYLGPALVNAQNPAAPAVSSVTSVASLGLTQTFSPTSRPSSFVFGGGIPTPSPSFPTWVGFPAVHSTTSGTSGNVGFNNGTDNSFWSASFVTDAPLVAIYIVWGTEPVNILIDGRKLRPGGVKGLAANTYFLLDFAKAGGRKQRTITVEDYGNMWFGGVSVDAASVLFAPPTTDRIRVAFLGSSIESGGNGFPLFGSPSWPEAASKLLGWSDPWNLGIGGTGYINNRQGQYFNYEGHADDAIKISPDIVVVGGPINDINYGATSITAAAVSLFRKLRAALPTTPIIAMGTFPASRGPDAAAVSSEIAIQTAVSQLNDPAIYFVPLISGQDGAVITGTGRVNAPNGNGNADHYISTDGTHLTQMGNDYLAAQTAARIRSIFVNKIH
jgi:hypothetical protein